MDVTPQPGARLSKAPRAPPLINSARRRTAVDIDGDEGGVTQPD